MSWTPTVSVCRTSFQTPDDLPSPPRSTAARTPRPFGPSFRYRQPAAVHLPVRRQRKRPKGHVRPPEPCIPAASLQVLPEPRTRPSSSPLPIPHTTYATSRLSPARPPSPPPPPPTPRGAQENTLDLPKLDPVTPHLHLLVHSPQELDRSVPQLTHQVSRPVQPLPRLPPRTGPARTSPPSAPACFKYPRASPSPPMYSSPATPTGTGSILRPARTPACSRSAARSASLLTSSPDPPASVAARERRALRRSIPVDHPGPRVPLQTALHVRPPTRFSPDRICFTPESASASSLHYRVEQSRRQPQRRHPLALQRPSQALPASGPRPAVQHQPSSVQQRSPDLECRRVERHRGQLQEHLLRSELRISPFPTQQPDHSSMRDLHSLRQPRRSRRVRSRTPGPPGPLVLPQGSSPIPSRSRSTPIQAHHVSSRQHSVPQRSFKRLLGQQNLYFGIPHHGTRALFRVRRIEGYVRRSCLHDPQQPTTSSTDLSTQIPTRLPPPPQGASGCSPVGSSAPPARGRSRGPCRTPPPPSLLEEPQPPRRPPRFPSPGKPSSSGSTPNHLLPLGLGEKRYLPYLPLRLSHESLEHPLVLSQEPGVVSSSNKSRS